MVLGASTPIAKKDVGKVGGNVPIDQLKLVVLIAVRWTFRKTYSREYEPALDVLIIVTRRLELNHLSIESTLEQRNFRFRL
jgi:hypothetical protein